VNALARLPARVPAWGSSAPGCWNITGTKNGCGYGVIATRESGVRRQLMAHRLSWEAAHGPVPDGLCVCHSCDNPACVRPDHLFLGDHSANMADKVAKGRQSFARGIRHGRAKLTEDDVIDIRTVRALGGGRADIARAYGVSEVHISGIVARNRWSHLP
jgi:hypothetical protein